MHDGMRYDPNQHQGQDHKASEFPKIALFKIYLLRYLQWELANDLRFLNYGTMSKFFVGRIFDICRNFVSRELELGGVLQLFRPQIFFPISMKFGT